MLHRDRGQLSVNDRDDFAREHAETHAPFQKPEKSVASGRIFRYNENRRTT